MSEAFRRIQDAFIALHIAKTQDGFSYLED